MTGDGKTSLRGGVGLFSDTRMMAGFMNAVTTNTPFSPTVSITTPQGPFSNPYLGITNPFPTPVPIPKNVAFPLPVIVVSLDPSGTYKVPVTYNWNLTVERQLAKGIKDGARSLMSVRIPLTSRPACRKIQRYIYQAARSARMRGAFFSRFPA